MGQGQTELTGGWALHSGALPRCVLAGAFAPPLTRYATDMSRPGPQKAANWRQDQGGIASAWAAAAATTPSELVAGVASAPPAVSLLLLLLLPPTSFCGLTSTWEACSKHGVTSRVSERNRPKAAVSLPAGRTQSEPPLASDSESSDVAAGLARQSVLTSDSFCLSGPGLPDASSTCEDDTRPGSGILLPSHLSTHRAAGAREVQNRRLIERGVGGGFFWARLLTRPITSAERHRAMPRPCTAQRCASVAV